MQCAILLIADAVQHTEKCTQAGLSALGFEFESCRGRPAITLGGDP